MTPVYLGANKNFMPGIMYETEEKFKVCTGVSIEDTEEGPKAVYETLTVTKGLPREITLDEALLRYFLGPENMRIISRKLTSYKAQKEAFSKLLNQVKYTGPLRWCTWDFFGETPLLILDMKDNEYTLLTSISVCSKYILKEKCTIQPAESIIRVSKELINEISSENVLKYFWCGSDTMTYLIKQNLPVQEYVNVLWNNIQ